MSEIMTELKPCPACEGDIVTIGLLVTPTIVNGHQACCGSCGVCGPERSNERAAADAWNAMPRHDAAAALTTAEARIQELEAALTPSADTKAAYEGRFNMGITLRTRHEEEIRVVPVPWDTIRDIMDAIRRRTLRGE